MKHIIGEDTALPHPPIRDSQRADKKPLTASGGVKYQFGDALVQEHILKRFDPDDPDVEYTLTVRLSPNRIETLSVEIRKGIKSKEVRLL